MCAAEFHQTLASDRAWFNGRIDEREAGAPSVASINFHLGTSVFDGLMAYWNRDHYYLHKAEEHLIRFQAGAARMGLEIPWSVDDMLRGISELLTGEPPGTQYVRPIAYRRAPELWVTGSEGRPVDVSIFTVKTKRDLDQAISCHVSPVERISSKAIPAQTKVSGAYVNSHYARRTAERHGFQDGIMLDRRGYLAEASAANLFVIARDRLFTPALGADVFPGITRMVALQLARELHIDVMEQEMTPEDLRDADGAFLCSTLMEIRAIDRLGERTLDTAASPVYRSILTAFRKMTHQ
jgi:branched-chain amino acid aminotransferase